MVGSSIDGKQVSSYRTDIPPHFCCPPLSFAVQITRPSFEIHYMRSQCLYVTECTRFRDIQGAVSHQCNALSVDTDDAV